MALAGQIAGRSEQEARTALGEVLRRARETVQQQNQDVHHSDCDVLQACAGDTHISHLPIMITHSMSNSDLSVWCYVSCDIRVWHRVHEEAECVAPRMRGCAHWHTWRCLRHAAS